MMDNLTAVGRVRLTCGHPSNLHGAAPCPREHDHPGECFWWIAWAHGGWQNGYWKAIAYRTRLDPGGGRIAVARADFETKPTPGDILALLQLLTRKREEEKAQRELQLAAPGAAPARPDWPVEDVVEPPTPAESAAGRSARSMVEEVRRGTL